MDYLVDYYDHYDEEVRLTRKYGLVEYRTTMKYIHKYLETLSKETARILEVGAGTGRYSVTLAREGYEVEAIELVESNLKKLKDKIIPTDRIHAFQGNALDLSRYKDQTFDMTLLLGPMYHLLTKEDMVKALQEAKRVTKVNGYIMVAYCMNEASIIQFGFCGHNLVEYMKKKKINEDFHCLSNEEDLFVMVRVEDIDALNQEVGVERQLLIATDGATGYMRDVIDTMSDKEFDLFLKYHESVCERQDLIGATNHSLDILRKDSL